MGKYVIGVDGGGTKSHLAIFDLGGNKLAFKARGTLNHECMEGSFKQLERELSEFLSGAIKDVRIDPDEVVFSVFGLAGIDTNKQAAIVSGIIKGIGFKNFALCNDAYLGISAASSDCTGICAINGTGCTVSGRNAEGKMLQIGGLGPISEDLGGGMRMGYSVVGRAYRSLFRSGEPTLLTELLFDELNIKSKYDFIESFTERLENGGINIAKFNRLLFIAAERGDKAARDILTDIAENYSGAITSMLAELDFPKGIRTRVIFAGSVFVKAEHPFLLDEIKRMTSEQNSGRQFEFILLEKPPAAGAVIWALRCAGADETATAKAYSQF